MNPYRAVCVLTCLAALCAAACAPRAAPDYAERLAGAQEGLEGDAGLDARREELEASFARERSETAIDHFELRVDNQDDGDYSLEVTARLPVPNPREVRARRETRYAETEASVSRFEAHALARKVERCFRSVESEAHLARVTLYETYAAKQAALLKWSDDWRRSGALNEKVATQFEIEAQINLVKRHPGPRREFENGLVAVLPELRSPAIRLVMSADVVRSAVRAHNPAIGVHQAVAKRYEALSRRDAARQLPWFKFVDFRYEPVSGGRQNEVGGQIAVEIPLGSSARADVDRYRALSRSQAREGDQMIEDQLRLALFALREFDHFEANSERWRELQRLGQNAQGVADRWWKERVAEPREVARLIDQAYAAENTVLDARERAAMAGCSLLAAAGVSLDDWPRR